MSRGLQALVACLAMLAPVGTAHAGTAAQANPHKDFRIAHDVVAAVNNYVQFTVFDDVSVGVEDTGAGMDARRIAAAEVLRGQRR